MGDDYYDDMSKGGGTDNTGDSGSGGDSSGGDRGGD